MMKKNFYVLFAILIANIFSAQSELVRWNQTNLSPTTYSSNLTAGNVISGFGVSSQNWDVSFFQISDIPLSATIDTSKYLQFSIAPNSNYQITLSSFNFTYRAQSSGQKFEVRYSTNSDFSSPQTLTTITTTDTSWHSLSQSNFTNPVIAPGKTMYIRFYIFNGNYNSFHISNGNAGIGPNITGTVAVNSPNPPVANNDTYSVYKNTETSLDILANDTSVSTINSITITQQPAHGTLNITGTSVKYTPASGYAGADTFKYKASNSTAAGLSNEATVSINVITAVPVANNDSYNVYNNTNSILNILSNDTSALAITGITITQQPAHGTLTVNGTSNVTYKSTAGYTGADSFKYQVSNVTGPSNEATVSISVTQDPNTAVPVANNDSYSIYNNIDTSLNILSNDTSVLAITGITITQQPAHGTLTVNGTSNVTYKSTAGYTGADSFKYQVSNVTGPSNEATVSINITQDPNTAVPVANDDSYTAHKNNDSDFNVLSNDTSVLAITSVTITQQPAHGTLTVNGTTSVTYKPTSSYTGTDSFKYKAGNATGLSNEAAVSINVVENVPEPLVRWNNSNFTPTFTSTHLTTGNVTATTSLSYTQNVSVNGVSYNAFQTSGWPNKNAQTIDTSKYIQFTISPKSGYKLNLSEFNFLCASQGGDANMRIDYSLNSNFSNPTTILPQTAINSNLSTISITNFSRPIATDGQTVYLRIYVYNTWNDMQILFRNGQSLGPVFIGTIESNSATPIAYNDTVSTTINDDIDVNVLSNDDYSSQVGSITFTQPSHGVTSLKADNSINYLPANGYLGTDTFTYYITNQFGVSNAATVTVNIVANTTTSLIRWENSNYIGTPFQSFVNPTQMTTAGGVSLLTGAENTPIYLLGNISDTSINTSKYIQFVLDNTSTIKTIEPKSFSYVARGYNGGDYEIRYSKNSNFTGEVGVLASGSYLASSTYETMAFNFTSTVKVEPGEKLYLRLYLFKNNSNYVIQYRSGDLGPAINGLFYNRIYSSTDTIWQNGANPQWSNGLPTATKNAIVNTNYNTAVNGNFESNNLTINAGGSLTVNSGGFVTVNGQIINNAAAANFIVENDGNLLQNNNAQNTGNIKVKKTAIIPKMGYNYWSSPVIGQNLYQFSDGYNQASTTGTGTPWNRFYVYNESNDYFANSVANEITLNSASVFQPARGYAIRGKNSFPDVVNSSSTPSLFEFNGVPQNGDVSFTLKYTSSVRGYNMVGNPYPSNIDLDDLFTLNSSKVYGVAYCWTNNDDQVISQQSNGYSGNNYAIYNGTGGTSATYYGYNNKKPNGYASIGQGFIVQVKAAGKNQPFVFNNSMRSATNANFYNKGAQKDRFWLEFKSPTNVNNEILLGYIPNATNNYDSNYDTELLSIGNDSFWSVLDTKKLGIQARQANLNTEDVVKLGIKASVSGNYTISLTDKEGIFSSNQTVYLKDKYLGKVINISSGSYVFASNSGQYEDRFEIIYRSQETLGSENSVKKGIQIYKDIQNFIVNSPEDLDEVSLYDSLGRLIFDSKNSKKEVLINKTNLPEGLYIIKARSGNTTLTKKVLK